MIVEKKFLTLSDNDKILLFFVLDLYVPERL